MSSPITWKNVNQPSFTGGNALVMAATRQLGDAFDSGSKRLIDQGEFNKKANTDDFFGQVGQYNNYDNLADARASLFQGIEGKNVDQKAALDYFTNYQNQLGEKEKYNTIRKDTADTKAGQNLALQLMNGGMTNQRELQSALMQEGQKNGWSDVTNKNIFDSINRQFAPTTEEAAQTDAAVATLKFTREMAKQAADNKAKRDRELIKKGKSTSGKFNSLINGAKSPVWKQILPGDGDAWAQRNAEAFLGKADAQVGTKLAKEIFARHTSGGVTEFGDAEAELEKTAAVQQQLSGITANDPVARALVVQSIMQQMGKNKEEAQAVVDHVLKLLKK